LLLCKGFHGQQLTTRRGLGTGQAPRTASGERI
jgi:hypothetical protein